MWTVLYFLVLIFVKTYALPRTDVTVSGLSSGGAMTAQLHLVYSSAISGSGVLAGPPYYCAENGAVRATRCLFGPAGSIPIAKLLNYLKMCVLAGTADPISNLMNDPVYIYSGLNDPIVSHEVVKLNSKIFESLNTSIKTNYEMRATHGFATNDFGASCDILDIEYYINNCSFNLAYDMLNHLFGGSLIRPNGSVPLTGQFLTIEQPALMNPESVSSNIISYWAHWLKSSSSNSSKLPGAIGISNLTLTASGFDKEGYIYYPRNCTQGNKCPIHVALHGCLQGKWRIGDVFAKKTGYLEVAELNNIIVLFPQIIQTYDNPVNPEGCWDWWGYGSSNYANKLGPQMIGVKKMIDTLKAINNAF